MATNHGYHIAAAGAHQARPDRAEELAGASRDFLGKLLDCRQGFLALRESGCRARSAPGRAPSGRTGGRRTRAREALWDPIIAADKYDDGLAAHVLRLGAGMAERGPDPKRSAGYYLFVINGSLDHEGKNYPLWSMIVVERQDDPVLIKAGGKGVEVMVLEFLLESEHVTN